MLRFILTISFLITACAKKRPFDSKVWKAHDGTFNERESMVEDLFSRYQFIGMTTNQVHNILGKPEFTNDSLFKYCIYEDYGFDIDPIAGKDLIFIYDKDSVILRFSIFEWKNK